MAIQLNTATKTMEPTTNAFRVHRMATVASLAGISWVCKNGAVATLKGFVFDKYSELPEVPFMYGFVPSAFASSDMFDILQNKDISGFEFFYDCFADNMVHVCLKPFLPPGHLFEMSLGGFCAFGLKTASQSFISFQHGNHVIVEELFFRCDRYRVYSDIDTDHSVVTKRFDVDVFGDHDMQEHPLLSIVDEVGRINIIISIFSVAVWNTDWHFDTTFDGAKGDNIILDAHTMSIIANGEKDLKNRLRTMQTKNRFKDFASLVSAATNKLCRESKKTANRFIGRIMQHTFVADMLTKTNIRDNLSRRGVLFHRLKENRVCRYLYFQRDNRFHTDYNTSDLIYSLRFLQFIPEAFS